MNKPHSLYIHIPFCTYLCDYCDFTKLQYFSNFIYPYLDALKVELASYDITELDTIYIGGGTPSSLNIDELRYLLDIVKPYSLNVKEYSVEANPDSLTLEKIKLLKEYHVNRISLGVESTDDKILASINRHHNFNDVINSVSNIRSSGISNINLDLIIGLPHVSKKMIEKDIANLISLDVNHISCYSLTVNPHTKFYIDGIIPPTDDICREYYDLVNTKLIEAGYIHYEISNWAKRGYQSLHNMTYWKNDHYYGVGLGASGYIKDIRYTNTKSINKYLAHKFIFEKEKVTISSDMNYMIMLNLRTIEGLNLKEFNDKFHIDLLKVKRNELEELVSNHFLLIENGIIKPTYEGMMILDSIILKLFL